MEELQRVGCKTVYLDGSFVSDKLNPDDFDGCWDETDIDFDCLDPVLLSFEDRRAAQKAKFRGELFPAFSVADVEGTTFFDFFQTDKETGSQKGIIGLDLGGFS